ERDRILLARRVAERLHHVAVDGFVVPSLEAELLELAHGALAEDVLIHVRARDVEIWRTGEARERVDDEVLRGRVLGDVAGSDDRARFAGLHIDREER